MVCNAQEKDNGVNAIKTLNSYNEIKRVILPAQCEPIVIHQRNLTETDYHHLILLNSCKI